MSDRGANGFYEANVTDYIEFDDRVKKIVDLVESYRPKNLLDIGCGRGALLTRIMAKHPTNATGLDISSSSVQYAKKQGLDVRQFDASAPLPFNSNTFDLVVLAEVIEHLYDPDNMLEEIVRVLVPNGVLILSTPNLASWFNRILLPFGVQPVYTEISTRKKYGRYIRLLGQGSVQMQGHIRVMTTTALLELLRDARFKIVEVHGCGFVDLQRFAPTRFIDNVFNRFPFLASGIVVAAQKDA